jgi:sugar phosphate isomerase/epimerase
MHPGVNLEFARSAGLGFEESLEAARQAGYEYVEPYVYSEIALDINSHLSLKSASGYHHIRTGAADARGIRERMQRLGLSFSAFDVHSALLLPQVGVPYLMKAIDLASEVHCPIVMSDEGPLPAGWMSLERGFEILCISLEAVIRHAEPKGVRVAVELHNALTTRPEYLARLLERFGPDELGVNFDTGNFFLAGNDPVEALRPMAHRVIHVHAKEIPASQLHERGHVTGTRVGVAVGDGVIDFAGIVAVLATAGFQGTLGVECDTLEQAARSLPRLRALISAAAANRRR